MHRVYPVYVALFGPSGAGKSLFLATFSGREPPSTPSSEIEEFEVVEEWRKFKEKAERPVLVETFKLVLRALPGRPELSSLRAQGLAKCVGLMLFYDATSPESARALTDMYVKEIESCGIHHNLIAVCVVGVLKGDQAPHDDAVKLAAELALRISQHTRDVFGYDVPHILVDVLNPENVRDAVRIVEHILMEREVPRDLVTKYAPKVALPPVKPKPLPAPPAPPKPPVVEVPKVPKAPETPAKPSMPSVSKTEALLQVKPATPTLAEVAREVARERPPVVVLRYQVKLHPRERAWDYVRTIRESVRAEKVALAYRVGNVVYVAFSPGEKSEGSIPRDELEVALELDDAARRSAGRVGFADARALVLVCSDGVLLLARRGQNILFSIKFRGDVSFDVINALIRKLTSR